MAALRSCEFESRSAHYLDHYQLVTASPTFPTIEATTLQRFVAACQQNGELVAKQQFRTWVRQRIAPQ